MQTITPTNFLDPSTLRMKNKNSDAITEFLVGAAVPPIHVPHLIVIDNTLTNVWITLYPDTPLSMLQ